MSDPTTREAALDLRGLAVTHRLTTLREVRIDPQVAGQAETVATRLLADENLPGLLARLPAPDWLPDLLDLAGRLLWSRQHAATRAVVALARAVGETPNRPGQDTSPPPPWEEICTGYVTLTELTARGPEGPGVSEAALTQIGSGLFRAADVYLVQQHTTRAALVASAGLWLLFHQELHDADPRSPLVTGPRAWLEPLYGSRVGRLLTSSRTARAPARAGDPGHESPLGRESPGGGTPRTAPLVLTGAYPRFAAPVVEALRDDPALQVSTLALSTVDKPFKRMAVEPWVVELRLRAGLGEPISYRPLEEALAGADTVLADWADAGAVLTSLLTPSGTALTVRVHSVDALRCWLHLVDWSAVDQLICVGPHVRDLIRELLGERLSGTRQVVLPNIVRLARFDHPRGPDTDHTLAMVGWARAVKDPLWTVELLARLRRHDDRWRLLLIGHGFSEALQPGGAAYAERFSERVSRPDVASAIELVPFTDNLPPVLARAGWVVSSSVRESWGVGPMEAVAAGAVPVIRDWPFFGRWGGPRRLYPGHWVVDSVQEAQERLLAVVAAGTRSRLAAESKALLADLVNPEQAAADYRSALADPAAPVLSGAGAPAAE